MGNFLSDILGTNSDVNVSGQNPYEAIQPWQQQQQNLTQILQAQANGTSGPNPAQQQLMQNEQRIAQQQAAQYAGNRALNPGLAARLAGNTAATTASTAAGNAGIQQAQQQLASQQLLGQTAAQGEQGINQAGALNAGVAAGNQQAAQGLIGGLLQAGGSALAGMSTGGVVPSHIRDISQIYHLDDGGAVSSKSEFKIPTLGDPVGELLKFQQLNSGGSPKPMKKGGDVPGKAKTEGDSPKNDTVAAMLSPGEVVIPRSVMNSDDPVSNAAKFVANLVRKNKGSKTPEKQEFLDALNRSIQSRRAA